MKCKNFESLPLEERIILEEMQYRKQMMSNHGFTPKDYESITKVIKKEVMGE